MRSSPSLRNRQLPECHQQHRGECHLSRGILVIRVEAVNHLLMEIQTSKFGLQAELDAPKNEPPEGGTPNFAS
jgi:hypothetical protein